MWYSYLFQTLLSSLIVALVCSCGGRNPQGSEAIGTDGNEIAQSEATPIAWRVGANPTCVVIDGDRVYVAHLGPEYEPGYKNGAGYISVYDANGQFVDTLISGLNSPLGMVVVGDVLYFTNVDQVYGVDKMTGLSVSDFLASPKHVRLGPIAAGPAGQFYVVDGNMGFLWTATPGTDGFQSKRMTVSSISDIAYDSKLGKLYVSTQPQVDETEAYIYEVDPATGEAARVGDYAGNLGAVEVVGRSLIFTDQGLNGGDGAVLSMDLDTRQVTVVKRGQGVRDLGPFAVLGDGLAFMPVTKGAEVLVIRL